MKIWKLLLVCLQIHLTNATMTHRFRSCKCTSYNETALKFTECYLKAYSRKLVTLNVAYTDTFISQKPILINLKFHYRYGTIMREVLHFDFEWCSVIEGMVSSPVAKAVRSVFKKSLQGTYRCPWAPGPKALRNITMDDTDFPLPIPSGIYKTEFIWKDLYKIEFGSEIVSEIKTSF